MGCNQSKAKDVEKSRERVPASNQGRVPGTPNAAVRSGSSVSQIRSPDLEIHSGMTEDRTGLGMSLTENKMAEESMFYGDVLAHVAENMIDVGEMDHRFIESDGQHAEISDICNRFALASIRDLAQQPFQLPPVTVRSIGNVVNILRDCSISREDESKISSIALRLREGRSKMRVRDAGRIVARLDF